MLKIIFLLFFRPKSIISDNDSKMNPGNGPSAAATGQVRFHEPNPRRVERKGSAPPSLKSDIVRRPAFRIDDYDQGCMQDFTLHLSTSKP